MGKLHSTFDGSEPELIDAERKLFEADAEPYGFDLTRHQCCAPEPWAEYANADTGHRWGGWLAGAAAHDTDAEAVAWAYGKCVALGLENGSMESAMMMDRLKTMLGGYDF